MANKELMLIARKPTHPGEVLREEYMPELGLSVASLAKALRVSRQTVNELIHERRALSPDMALRLGRYFGTTAQYWLNMQRNVDLWNSFDTERTELDNIIPFQLPSAIEEAEGNVAMA